MNQRPSMTPFRTGMLPFGFAILLAAAAAAAQAATSGIDASGSYRNEVQACRLGATAEDTDTCLKEARNAQAARKNGQLDTHADFEANALARCDVFTRPDDKAACEARVKGEGSTSGSVAGGGMLREYETVVPPASAH
jgi:hypothetical protein